MFTAAFTIRALASAVALVFACAAAAGAQPAVPPPAAAQPAPGPTWAGSFSVAPLMWQSGATEQFTARVDVTITRVHSTGWTVSLMADSLFGRVRVDTPAGPIEQTVANTQTVRAIGQKNLTPRTFLMVQPAYSRNSVQRIDYSIEGLGGYGVRLWPDERGQGRVNVVGIAGVVDQDKNIPAVDGVSAAVGVYQTATAVLVRDTQQPNRPPVWQWLQHVLHVRDLQGGGEDYRTEFETKLQGQILRLPPALRGAIMVELSYRLMHESVVLPGTQEHDQTTTVAFGWTF